MPYNEPYFSNLYDLVGCITQAVDLISTEVSDHHRRVAFLSYAIADTMRLPLEQKRTLALAALLHDIGSIPLSDQMDSNDRMDFVRKAGKGIHDHARIGARLFADFPILADVASVIRFHHVSWENGAGSRFEGEAVPFSSHILHLADRVVIAVRHGENIIGQIRALREMVNGWRGCQLHPDAVDAFLRISDREALWLDLTWQPMASAVPDDPSLKSIRLTLDEVVDLTQIFSRIIDFRSPFTAMHFAGVAAVALRLAQLSGFSENECKMMRIAGHLHDIGKLAVPREILEKQDRLEPDEYDIIRSHSFYTYRLLNPIGGFETITEWAAFHHEKLNGRGYPFHLHANGLSFGARIMAVADIFTAITEDRPYREGMPKERVASVLQNMAQSGGISPSIFSVLMEHYDAIAALRKDGAKQAVARYEQLLRLPKG